MSPLPKNIAPWSYLRISNPFTVTFALLFALVSSVIFALMVSINDFYEIQPGRFFGIQFLIMLVHYLLITAPIFLYCFMLFGHCTRRLAPSQSPSKYVWTSILGSLVLAFLCSMLTRWMRIHLFNDLGVHDVIGLTSINDELIASSAVFISMFVLALTRRQQVVIENSRLLSEQLLTRYEALEKQVDPHFLFNSLNTLGGLIGVDDPKASQYLQQLSTTFRYVMQQHENHTVTLADEMEFVDNYIALMQTRYGANLQVERNIPEEMLFLRVPPISVQLLIENAIKHNVISDRHPLSIEITTTPDGMLRVSNLLQPKQDQGESSTHIGLTNLSQRYQMLQQPDIVISKTDTHFIVDIPLIQS